MNFENGNVVELETNERYFIYDQTTYNDRNFALLVNIDDSDKIDILEVISKTDGMSLDSVDDDALKQELAKIFNRELN